MDHSAVQAYSHWTHHVTDGKIMVVDCQGAFDAGSRTFNLTGPAVHCTDMTRFDRTNLGPDGMRRFFSTHKCNDHCHTLGISSRESVGSFSVLSRWTCAYCRQVNSKDATSCAGCQQEKLFWSFFKPALFIRELDESVAMVAVDVHGARVLEEREKVMTLAELKAQERVTQTALAASTKYSAAR